MPPVLRRVPCRTPQPEGVECYRLGELSLVKEFDRAHLRWHVSISADGRKPTDEEVDEALAQLSPMLRANRTEHPSVMNPNVRHFRG